MSSWKPKEGGSEPPITHQSQSSNRMPIVLLALVVLIVAVSAIAYSQYSAKTALEARIASLDSRMKQDIEQIHKDATSLASDIDVVTKRIGVTTQELDQSRKFAEQLRMSQEKARQEQEKAQAELTGQLATKASTSDVAAARDEASSKVAAAQKEAETKITGVSGEVQNVASNLESTKQDLVASRREISDVRTTLSQQIARNSSELSDLRRKGERDYFEFDIKKDKKNAMQRVADIQVGLRDTDAKKQKYAIALQVDDSKIERKDLPVNQPLQFLVGRDQLRYEIVVNTVDKDRIRGYVSAPKDKTLSSERPNFKN